MKKENKKQALREMKALSLSLYELYLAQASEKITEMNSCLIRHKDTQLLIDCGSTKKYLMESFKKVGACVDDTNGVLISHAHSDHVSQLKHFNHLDVYSYCDLKDALGYAKYH